MGNSAVNCLSVNSNNIDSGSDSTENCGLVDIMALVERDSENISKLIAKKSGDLSVDEAINIFSSIVRVGFSFDEARRYLKGSFVYGNSLEENVEENYLENLVGQFCDVLNNYYLDKNEVLYDGNVISITKEEMNIWQRTIIFNELLPNSYALDKSKFEMLLNLYRDLRCTPNREGNYLGHSEIINLFDMFCSVAVNDLSEKKNVADLITILLAEDNSMHRKRLVSSILDGGWYRFLENLTGRNKNSLLDVKLYDINNSKNGPLDCTIRDILRICCPEAIQNNELSDKFYIKEMYKTAIIKTRWGGEVNCYYHSPRYLVKAPLNFKLCGENIESIEIRIHGADFNNDPNNDRCLPCIKFTALQQNKAAYHFCLMDDNLESGEWKSASEVENSSKLKDLSHIFFTPLLRPQ